MSNSSEILDFKNPKLLIDSNQVKPGEINWRSPSNIAIIKYWGKFGVQLPKNPSVSFTLNQAYSQTKLSYRAKEQLDKTVDLNFRFHGKEAPKFAEKIEAFLISLSEVFPFIQQLHFEIESENSFPHSAGIASSASGMSALALCLCSLEHQLFGSLKDDALFRKKASFIARLGSGSACRSIYPQAAVWGRTVEVNDSDDLFAVPYADRLHPEFQAVQDSILLISKKEKSVSSRAGHQLMEDNIYAENRYTQARQRLHRVFGALQAGDWEEFGQITENEALTLHALMMLSTPSYLLMEPNSLEAIYRIRAFRKEQQLPLYFTLDAGPNIHLLYPGSIKEKVHAFIESDLADLCEKGQYIHDFAGNGPVQL